ncbi:MAG: hypothetical protein FJY98_02395 [Candidatus Liptonbacteria bacterium]|nr:hypothetical protein [Candidatus Liptonbacteria bacterium]
MENNNRKVGWVIAIIVIIVLVWWFMASTPAPSAPTGGTSDSSNVASLEGDLNSVGEPSGEDLNSVGADIEGSL